MNAAVRGVTAGATEFDEPSSRLPWLVPASVALHVALIGTMPSATRVASAPLPAMVVEVAAPPPEPPLLPATPEPAPPEPEAAPRPATPNTTRPASPAAPARAASAEPAATTDVTSNEAAADFTGTLMTSDGPGVGVRAGTAGGGSGGPGATPGPTAPATVRANGPRFVAAGDLSKPPRPPALDGALERNYPADARRAGVAGRAVLRVKIRADGRVGRVERVSETWQGFGEACERTVRSAPWEPPVDQDGALVETEITYTCRFEIRS